MTIDRAPIRVHPDSGQAEAILDLIRRCFASMEGRIDPPSSMHRLTAETIAQHCHDGEVWIISTPPVACVFLTPKADCLYLGKLAVDAAWRGQGLAALLVDHAMDRARALGLNAVELQVRVELVENHRAFAKMGFVKTGETAHPGYDRPTSITMQRAVL
ncbi:MAG: GNAT family N-acetyltransferase [Roseovarius sp.]|uniref:GNAT family N-acetyltransferase n=1 Tax=Roseovarius sp. TaxID=1486281 RepID=UPI001B4D0425|nr:GNAT family N-acetyltransferase [Roseovarius sp.]MBQ0752458.1 GNAT family N-acetyltransferase [Roseovarius sp.]MBQ0809257.1 GNAT family N-acetyltransferase [Roseovarius sp.]